MTTTPTCPDCQQPVDNITQTFIPLDPDQMPDHPDASTWKVTVSVPSLDTIRDMPAEQLDQLTRHADQLPQGVVGWHLDPCAHLVRGDQYHIQLDDIPDGDDPVCIDDLISRFVPIPTDPTDPSGPTPGGPA